MTDKERLEVIKMWHSGDVDLHQFQIDWLIEQAERVEELEAYVEENSRKSVELNLFLQKRNKPEYLGLHVVDAVMKYVQELESIKESHIEELGYVDERLLEAEQQNKHYRKAIQKAISEFNQDEHQRGMAELQKALRE